MTQRDNILQELNGLKSTLSNLTPQNIYEVPDGYFDGLANQVLNRIKATEAESAKEELHNLSQALNNISKKIPYSPPDGYFDELEERLMNKIRESEDYQTAKEELNTISPLLSGLNKEMPFSVPKGYFDKVAEDIHAKLDTSSETKVIALTHRKWFRYAAAAVVVAMIAMAGLVFRNHRSIDPEKNPDAWIAKNMKKVNTNKLDDFLQLTDEESANKEQTVTDDKKSSDEIKDLLKDVPESQIQEFLNETAALGNSDAGNNTSLN